MHFLYNRSKSIAAECNIPTHMSYVMYTVIIIYIYRYYAQIGFKSNFFKITKVS